MFQLPKISLTLLAMSKELGAWTQSSGQLVKHNIACLLDLSELEWICQTGKSRNETELVIQEPSGHNLLLPCTSRLVSGCQHISRGESRILYNLLYHFCLCELKECGVLFPVDTDRNVYPYSHYPYVPLTLACPGWLINQKPLRVSDVLKISQQHRLRPWVLLPHGFFSDCAIGSDR